jgi:hypothetical protein
MPELVDLARAALPAVTALIGVALGGWLQSRRETVAYRRAVAAARAERMRGAFEPVVVAAMGIKAAAAEYMMSSGDPRVNAREILDRSLKTVNEARAQLMLEDNLGDVFSAFDEIWNAFQKIQFEIGGRMSAREAGHTGGGPGLSADDMKAAFATVNEGATRLADLMRSHLRRIEH